MIQQFCFHRFNTLFQSPKSPDFESCRNSISAVGGALFLIVAGFIATGSAIAQTSSETVEPADHASICKPLGTAYFYVPSMESCVRIGGELRVRQTYSRLGHSDKSAAINYEARSRTYTDAWRDSELGVVRTFVLLEGTSGPNPNLEFDQFLLRIGSLDIGRVESITNMDQGSYVFRDAGYFSRPNNTVWQVKYTLGLGQGIFVSKAIEQPVGSYSDTVLKQDSNLPDITLAANYVQDWGELKISGGSHMNQTNSDVFRVRSDNDQEFSKLGYFGSIGAQFNVTQSLKAGLTGSYADGALARIGIGYPSDSIYYNRIMINSKGHNFFGGFSYDFNPGLKFNANAGFHFSREGYDKNKQKLKSYLAGTSFDYRLLKGTTLTFGGRYEESDLSKTNLQPVDSDGKDRRLRLITQIRYQF